jgi:hypothetical protein
MDSTPKHKHNVITKMIETHLDMIMRSRTYGRSMKYVFIEANYGGYWAVDIIKNIVQQPRFAPIEVVSYDETAKDRAGIWMSQGVKECMAGVMQRSLADGQLCFAKEFITQRGPNLPDIKKEYREQLINYRQELIEPHDVATGTSKAIITGKTSGGRKDDLCIVSQIALYFSGKKKMESSFRELANERGWRV